MPAHTLGMNTPTSDHASSPSSRPMSITKKVLIGAATLLVLLAAGLGVRTFVAGVPLLDEWACAKGEAPVIIGGTGSACAEEGATLADDEEWNPLGNHPLECKDRWGWTPVSSNDGNHSGCLAKGEDMPEGWSAD